MGAKAPRPGPARRVKVRAPGCDLGRPTQLFLRRPEVGPSGPGRARDPARRGRRRRRGNEPLLRQPRDRARRTTRTCQLFFTPSCPRRRSRWSPSGVSSSVCPPGATKTGGRLKGKGRVGLGRGRAAVGEPRSEAEAGDERFGSGRGGGCSLRFDPPRCSWSPCRSSRCPGRGRGSRRVRAPSLERGRVKPGAHRRGEGKESLVAGEGGGEGAGAGACARGGPRAGAGGAVGIVGVHGSGAGKGEGGGAGGGALAASSMPAPRHLGSDGAPRRPYSRGAVGHRVRAGKTVLHPRSSAAQAHAGAGPGPEAPQAAESPPGGP